MVATAVEVSDFVIEKVPYQHGDLGVWVVKHEGVGVGFIRRGHKRVTDMPGIESIPGYWVNGAGERCPMEFITGWDAAVSRAKEMGEQAWLSTSRAIRFQRRRR